MSLTTSQSTLNNARLTELSLKLEKQEFIEFEFGKFIFWQFEKALKGQRVQLVTGTMATGITIKQMNEMDSDTLEFSILFCKNRLRTILNQINENDNEDQRKSLIKEISKELETERKNLNTMIFLLEDISFNKSN